MVGWVLDALGRPGWPHRRRGRPRRRGGARGAAPGVGRGVQGEQLGTGHATQVGLAALDRVRHGPRRLRRHAPAARRARRRAGRGAHRREPRAATMLTAVVDDAGAYGRVVRAADGTSPGSSRRATRRPRSSRSARTTPASTSSTAAPWPPRSTGLGPTTRRARSTSPTPSRSSTAGRAPASPTTPRSSPGSTTRRPRGLRGRDAAAPARGAHARRGHHARPGAVCVDAGVRVGPTPSCWPGTHLRGATSIGAGCAIGPDVVIATAPSARVHGR